MTTEHRSIIPANPGWTLLSYYLDNKGSADQLDHDDIIAWEIVRAEGPYTPSVVAAQPKLRGATWNHWYTLPIITEGAPDDISNRHWAIKSPNGKICGEDGDYFKDEAAFLEAAREYDRKQKTG